MGLWLAGSARSALANAGIHTLIVDARLVVGTLVVAQALTLHLQKATTVTTKTNKIKAFFAYPRAVRQWIARVARQAVADRPFTSSIVMAGYAERICAARIWLAEILC